MRRSRLFRNHATPFLPTDAPNLYYWHDMSAYKLTETKFIADGDSITIVYDLSKNPINKNIEALTANNEPTFRNRYVVGQDCARMNNTNAGGLYTFNVPNNGETTAWFDLGFHWVVIVGKEIITTGGAVRPISWMSDKDSTENMSFSYRANATLQFRVTTVGGSAAINLPWILTIRGPGDQSVAPNILYAYKRPQTQNVIIGMDRNTTKNYNLKTHNLGDVSYRAIGVNAFNDIALNNAAVLFCEQFFYLGDIPESTMRESLNYAFTKWTGQPYSFPTPAPIPPPEII